jgi:hypothetical protein
MLYRIRTFCIFAATVSLFVTGCSVKINQLETAKRLIPAVQHSLRGGTDSQTAAAYVWEFSFNGGAFIVYPVEAQGRNVIFRNANDLRIVWDGESLVVIEGMPGAFGRYEQGVEGEQRLDRWYARQNSPTLRLTCTPQRDWRLTEDRKGWRQECTGLMEGRSVRAEHGVEFDRNDNIREIRSTLVPTAGPAVLRRLAG